MEKFFMAALGGVEGLGNKSIARLVKIFGSAKAVWSADVADMVHTGIKQKTLTAFQNFRREHPDAPEKLAGYCERQKINLCAISDEDYPPILKEIDSPPMFFYYRGKLQPDAQRIGIVGSRQNTQYGQSIALELGRDLAAAGLTVVSGAARGIDTFAHRGALKTGRTVAVLGCGINYIYPLENRKLFEQIIESGVVMSEFHPQMPPNIGTFPTRNRIIAGLSRGIIVVEAGKKSGALITGDFAADNNRDVFVVPGSVYSEKSIGCHNLIRRGGRLIKNARDVLAEYQIAPAEFETVELDGIEAKIFEVIPSDGFITEDEILEQFDEISPDELSTIMLALDMKNCIEELSGRFKRKPVNVVKPKDKSKPKPVELGGIEAKVFEIIPANDFITEDEILEQLDEIQPSDLPDILLKLELKRCVELDAGRYKRKFGG